MQSLQGQALHEAGVRQDACPNHDAICGQDLSNHRIPTPSPGFGSPWLIRVAWFVTKPLNKSKAVPCLGRAEIGPCQQAALNSPTSRKQKSCFANAPMRTHTHNACPNPEPKEKNFSPCTADDFASPLKSTSKPRTVDGLHF